MDVNTNSNTATSLGAIQDCIFMKTGTSRTVDIWITQVTNLLGWGAFLNYNPAVIDITNVDIRMFQTADGATNLFNASDPVPSSDGSYYASGIDLTAPPNQDSGSGVLARLTIRAVGPGVSPLDLANVWLTDADGKDIGDLDGNGTFDGTIADGSIEVDQFCPGTTPIVTTLGIDAQPAGNTATSLGAIESCRAVTSGSSFTIDFFITDVTNLAGWAMPITYNPAVLRVTAVNVQLFQAANGGSNVFNTSSPVPDTDGAWEAGAFDLNAPPYQDSGTGVLARVTLNAFAAGSSPLTVGDPNLVDPTGAAIGDVTDDGVFDGAIRNAQIVVNDVCPTSATSWNIADAELASLAGPDDLAPVAARGTAESGAQCNNSADDDADTLVNDGCPGVPGNQLLVVPSVSENLTVTWTVRNGGPFGPVNVSLSISAPDVDADADTSIDCNLEPNAGSAALSLPVGIDTAGSQGFAAFWADDPAPPYYCTLTIQGSLTITSANVSDSASANNTRSLALDIVRDTDGDGVPDNYAGVSDPVVFAVPSEASLRGVAALAAATALRDNCPFVTNPDQVDTNADGRGDVCDEDDDSDGIPDATDNCRLVENTSQANVDGDAYGDSCDKDADGDGFLNATESAKGADALNAGSTVEVCDAADNDGDSLIDEGYDRNGSGGADCFENTDSDGDGIANPADPDDDNDGFTDAQEQAMGTDSLDACPDAAFNPWSAAKDDAWPPDTDSNGLFNVTDVFGFRGVIPSAVGQSAFDRRLDISANSIINVQDVNLLRPLILSICS